MISSAQIRLVQTARRALGIDEEAYRALLKAEAGVISTKDLDNHGLDRILKRFKKLGFNNTAKRERRPGGTITKEQQALIEAQYEQLERLTAAAGNAGFATMAARMGFNRRQCGKSFPQTRADSIRVIEGQKAYIARLQSRLSV